MGSTFFLPGTIARDTSPGLGHRIAPPRPRFALLAWRLIRAGIVISPGITVQRKVWDLQMKGLTDFTWQSLIPPAMSFGPGPDLSSRTFQVRIPTPLRSRSRPTV